MTDHDDTAGETHRSPLGVLVPILRRWPLLLLLAVAGAVGGFLAYSRRPAVYESVARLQVSKRYDAGASDGKVLYLEDYVATMTQIIASDKVLGAAARTLQSAQLADPLPDDPVARVDQLKAALGISRVRDANGVATTSSSVLSLRYACGDPNDAKKVLDAVIRAVQDHLEKGYSDAVIQQEQLLDATLTRKKEDRTRVEGEMQELLRDLTERVTTEELPLIRSRVTTNSQQSFTLQLELIGLERDLAAIAEVGAMPAARREKLRQVTGVARTAAEAAGPTAAEAALLQLNARRLELNERLGKDHPAMKEVDGQLEFYRQLAGRAFASEEVVDELGLYEGRLKERRKAAELQRDKLDSQIKSDNDKLKAGGLLQDKVELKRRQQDELTLEISRLEDRRAGLDTRKSGTRAYEAEPLDNPRIGYKVGPSLPTWVVPGFVLGLLAGVGLAFLAEMADQSFRTPAEIRRRLGVPVFAHVPPIRLDEPATADVSAAYDPALVVARRPKSVEAETYRGLRTQLLVTTTAAGHKLIQVTSPNPGDGKSTTAANLAISLAQAGKRVALIDADFRKPRVHALFALDKPDVGLASVVNGTTDLDAAVRPCDVDNLFILPCGPRPANPAELLAGERFAAILAELKGRYDLVIIDTPPLLAVSDPLVVASRADAVVLVFGITRRSRSQVERAKEMLADTGANLIGVVVNGAAGPTAGTGYGAGAYQNAYDYQYQYAEQYDDDVSIR